jgi:hypothetical protein
VAKDLGTWPPAQATVLVQVLQRARLTPDAKRTKAGIVVTVPDEQADQAVRVLADNMDAIADAARAAVPSLRAQRERARRSHPSQRPLATERLLSIARPLSMVLLAVLVLGSVARLSPLLALAGIGAVVYLLGRRAQQDGGDGRR